MRVLRMRAPTVLRELGGVDAEPIAAEAAPAPPPMEVSSASVAASSTETERATAAREVHVERSWLAGLTRRVVSVFVDLPPPAPVTLSFAEALEDTLAGLDLAGDVVLGVNFARSGRPVRWRRSDRRIVVNRDH